MHSYLELLNELREAVSTDAIPEKDKEKIEAAIQGLFDLLWPYSD